MKRLLILVIITSILLTSLNVSMAQNGVKVNIDGSSFELKQVAVLMDGKAISSEVPSFVMGDRTLVPVRFVAESFGAKVGWEQSTKTASIAYGDKLVALSIDKNEVYINGELRYLDQNSIPKLVTFTQTNDARTMVPVRFVSEVLGYDVGWDQSSYTALITTPKKEIAVISSIDLKKASNGSNAVVIKSNEKLNVNTTFLTDSNKLVVDIENAKLEIPGKLDSPGDLAVEDNSFSRVQFSQFTIPPNPYSTRVVLTMPKQSAHRLAYSKDGLTMAIGFDYAIEELVGNTEVPKPPVEPNIPVPLPNSEQVYITKEIIDNREVMVVTTASSEGFGLNYKLSTVSDPFRAIVDIENAILLGDVYQSFPYTTGNMNGVRASQYVPDPTDNTQNTVRLVFDSQNTAQRPKLIAEVAGNRLIISPEINLWDYISYERMSDRVAISVNKMAQNTHTIAYDDIMKEVIVTLPTESFQVPAGTHNVNDTMVRRVYVDKEGMLTRIRFAFRKNVILTETSNPDSAAASFIAIRNANVVPSELTVAIDIGHGGRDPGAMSSTINEKEINLLAGLKLRDALIAEGYNVVMTRTADTYVDLYDRPRIANNANADLFISIHANSHINTSARGLEVLYCPANTNEIKIEDQYPFAKLIHDHIVANTGIPTRGIIKRPKLVVLNRTLMPAVLIEMGFLSNPSDNALIRTPEYQNGMVRGVVNAVKEYFEVY